MSKETAQPGDTVELKDKDGGFTDPDTGFDISRDQKVKLGDSIGQRTQQAIMRGGLLIVSGKGKSSKVETSSDVAIDLPEDLPGREAFIAAGMNFDAVKAFDFEKDKVAGVGAGTIKALKEYAEKERTAR